MNMVQDSAAEPTPLEWRELRRLASFMVPASAEYGVPGADDDAIFADIVGSLGRDGNAVCEALAVLRALGLEPRSPFPKGHTLEQGDWSLHDAVRARPRMWRDVDGAGI